MKRYCYKRPNCNTCHSNPCQCNQFNFHTKKENTLCSLYEVENFLCNFTKALKCLNIYCLFK